MKNLSVTTASFLLVFPAFAEAPPQLPETKPQYYQAGELFAHCGAYWEFVASFARTSERPAAAEEFNGRGRGWFLPGMLLLALGMDTGREAEAKELFGNLVEVEITRLKALKEANAAGWGRETMEDYKNTCVPWVDFQKALNDGVRGKSPE
jgi:hypothetical protein